MKVWITKYALTKGVFSCEAEICSGIATTTKTIDHWYGKPDWHETETEAVKRAKEMCVAKIGSLKKALAKTQKLNFEVTK